MWAHDQHGCAQGSEGVRNSHGHGISTPNGHSLRRDTRGTRRTGVENVRVGGQPCPDIRHPRRVGSDKPWRRPKPTGCDEHSIGAEVAGQLAGVGGVNVGSQADLHAQPLVFRTGPIGKAMKVRVDFMRSAMANCPPGRTPSSMSVTRAPASASSRAAVRPAGPAPTTNTRDAGRTAGVGTGTRERPTAGLTVQVTWPSPRLSMQTLHAMQGR